MSNRKHDFPIEKLIYSISFAVLVSAARCKKVEGHGTYRGDLLAGHGVYCSLDYSVHRGWLDLSGGPSGLAVVRPAPRPSILGLRARASALDPGIR